MHLSLYVNFKVCISYSTIVLYSRDHAGMGVAYDRIFPQNQPQFSPSDIASAREVPFRHPQ